MLHTSFDFSKRTNHLVSHETFLSCLKLIHSVCFYYLVSDITPWSSFDEKTAPAPEWSTKASWYTYSNHEGATAIALNLTWAQHGVNLLFFVSICIIVNQCFPTRVHERLWMSPQVIEANSQRFCWYRCVLMTTGLYFDKLWKHTETWFSLKFVNVGHKPTLLKLVFVLFSYFWSTLSPWKFILVWK